jgi:hypothetical protein
MAVDEGDKITTRGKLCENVPEASISILSLAVQSVREVLLTESGEKQRRQRRAGCWASKS